MKTKIKKYNFFKNNGYCILNLFNKNDIKQLKTKLSKKLNTTVLKTKVSFLLIKAEILMNAVLFGLKMGF